MSEESEIEQLKKRNAFLEKELIKEKKANNKIEKEINRALKKGTHKTTTYF